MANRGVFDGGVRFLRIRAMLDRFRQSLFFLPAILVSVAVVLGIATLLLDRIYGAQLSELVGLHVSPESGRAILSTVAGGTIGAISVVFSLTLVAIQLAASQFSPRVIRGILGDQVQQIILGTVVGTFTYSLIALQGLQTTDDVPTLPVSVYIATLMGVISLLAVLASIDRTARSLEVGAIIERISTETLALIERQPYQTDASVLLDDAPTHACAEEHPDAALRVEAGRAGWVNQISLDGILDALPGGATAQLAADLGMYAQPGTALLHAWPVPAEDRENVRRALREAFSIEPHRNLQQDIGFGILQLVDIAQRALSPGVNDPNTANEVIVRLGVLLTAMGERNPGVQGVARDDRAVWVNRVPSLDDRLLEALDPIHRYARTEPSVLATLVHTLAQTRSSLRRRPGCDPEAVTRALHRIREQLGQLPTIAEREQVQRALDAPDPA